MAEKKFLFDFKIHNILLIWKNYNKYRISVKPPVSLAARRMFSVLLLILVLLGWREWYPDEPVLPSVAPVPGEVFGESALWLFGRSPQIVRLWSAVTATVLWSPQRTRFKKKKRATECKKQRIMLLLKQVIMKLNSNKGVYTVSGWDPLRWWWKTFVNIHQF